MRTIRRKLNTRVAAICSIGIGALALASVASGATVQAGNLVLSFGGSVVPSVLPKSTMAPVSLKIDGKLATTDGSQPPAAKEVIVYAEKNPAVNASGLPVCKASQLQAEDTQQAEKACPKAIVGRGSTEVRVQFPESTPFTAKGPLVLFNGGTKGGKTLLLIQAYVSVPTPTALVSTVTITKEHSGIYGAGTLAAVAQIPTIAGGSGSLTEFSFDIHRLFTYKGHKESYLTARCSSGHFDSRTVAKFAGGVEISGNIVQPCKAKS
jgi:hypothetical protein